MTSESTEARTLTFIAAHLGANPDGPPKARQKRRPVVTVSRQTGAGGRTFGEALCAYLEKAQPKGKGPWALVDKELVDKILEDNCRKCHGVTPQYSAPMSLVTWSDLHARAPSDESKSGENVVGMPCASESSASWSTRARVRSVA